MHTLLRRCLLSLLFGTQLVSSFGAGTPHLVKDINPTKTVRSSHPNAFCKVGSTLFFAADDGDRGRGLWKTVGSLAGTTLVAAVQSPGGSVTSVGQLTAVGTGIFFVSTVAGGNDLWWSDGSPTNTRQLRSFNSSDGARSLTAMGSRLFFGGYDSASGFELWTSDGTEDGTVMVKDIYPGTDGSFPAEFTVMGGCLYFVARESNGDEVVWKSDGTAAGTVRLGGSGFSGRLTVVGNTLYFRSADSTHGYELWKTDGTVAGTMMVADIKPGTTLGANHSDPASLTAVGDLLYFYADDGVHGDELWKTDGTAAGTVMVMDINPGTGSSFPNSMMQAGGTLYFAANDGVHGNELWKTDGTAAGTELVIDIRSGLQSSNVEYLVPFGNSVLFRAYDATHGRELWISDGTEAGTVIVKDIGPGTSSGVANKPGLGDAAAPEPRAMGGAIYFLANDGIHGSELWKTDGTEAGTFMVKDASPGTGSCGTQMITVLGGQLVFPAFDPVHGDELWTSDGTELGTTLIQNIASDANSSEPDQFLAMGGILYFTADDGAHGHELWRSDGTEAGTVMVKDINPGASESYPSNMVEMGGILYFDATSAANGNELWRSDGTEAGTFLVKDIQAGSSSSLPSGLTLFSGLIYFSANDGAHGYELWKSDGTAAGTVLAEDVVSGATSSSPASLHVAGSALFFTTGPGNSTYHQLRRRTSSSTKSSLMGDIVTNGGGQFNRTEGYLCVMGSSLFYIIDDPVRNGFSLMRINGANGGPVFVANPTGWPVGIYLPPVDLTPVGTTLYLATQDFSQLSRGGLWKSNGTSGATFVKEMYYPDFSVNRNPARLTAVGNTLYYSSPRYGGGLFGGFSGPSVLWRTDGGAPVEVKEVPMTNPSAAGSTLFFASEDAEHGIEPWQSDGTTAGTVMIADLTNDSSHSYPGDYTQAGGQLFFHATTNPYGEELWALALPTPEVLTLAATAVTTATATLKGSVNPAGDPSTAWFEYGPTTGYGTRVNLTLSPASGLATQALSASLTGLLPETTYHYRIVGQNSRGVSQGDDASFTTAALPAVQFALPDSMIAEATGTASIALTLSYPPAGKVTVPFTLSAGTGLLLTGTGADVTVSGLSVVFNPAETSKTIIITIKKDNTDEDDETLTLALGSPTGAKHGALTQHTMTILDDDTRPVMTASPQHQLVTIGSPIALKAAATGSAPLSYVWKLNGRAIAGATGPVYFIQKAALAHAGTYSVTAVNPAGSAVPAICEVGVYEKVVRHLTALATKDVTFTQLAAGNGLSFHWYQDGSMTELAGDAHQVFDATRKTLKLLHPLSTAADAGAYQCQVLQAASNDLENADLFDFDVVTTKPVLSSVTLANGQVGVHYQASVVSAADPATVSTWSATGLPAGLSMNALTGEISGFPTTPVVAKAVIITATNAAGSTSMSPAPTLTITALPAGVAGTWNGLIERHATVNNLLGSRLEITIAPQGTYTGKWITGTVATRISGQMAVTGSDVTAGTVFYQTGNVRTELRLAFKTTDSPPALTGTVQVQLPGDTTAVSVGLRAWRAHASPLSYAGRHSFAMQLSAPDDVNPALPHGTGFGAATVTSAGAVTVAGRAGDGASYTSASFVGTGGECLLYASLYSGKGTLSGIPVLALADASVADMTHTTWNKLPDLTASGARNYPAGWQPVVLQLQGSKYAAPSPGAVVMGLTYTAGAHNARLAFTSGGISSTPPVPDVDVNLKSTGLIEAIPSASNPRKTTLAVTSSTGAFTGTIAITDKMPNGVNLARPVTYYGQIVRIIGATPEVRGVGVFSLPQLPATGISPMPSPTTTPILAGTVDLRP